MAEDRITHRERESELAAQLSQEQAEHKRLIAEMAEQASPRGSTEGPRGSSDGPRGPPAKHPRGGDKSRRGDGRPRGDDPRPALRHVEHACALVRGGDMGAAWAYQADHPEACEEQQSYPSADDLRNGWSLLHICAARPVPYHLWRCVLDKTPDRLVDAKTDARRMTALGLAVNHNKLDLVKAGQGDEGGLRRGDEGSRKERRGRGEGWGRDGGERGGYSA